MSSNAGIYFKDNLRPINAKRQKSFKDACTNKYLLYLTVFFQIINAILGMDIALYIFVFAHFTSSLRSFRKVLQIKESIWCITDWSFKGLWLSLIRLICCQASALCGFDNKSLVLLKNFILNRRQKYQVGQDSSTWQEVLSRTTEFYTWSSFSIFISAIDLLLPVVMI